MTWNGGPTIPIGLPGGRLVRLLSFGSFLGGSSVLVDLVEDVCEGMGGESNRLPPIAAGEPIGRILDDAMDGPGRRLGAAVRVGIPPQIARKDASAAGVFVG